MRCRVYEWPVVTRNRKTYLTRAVLVLHVGGESSPPSVPPHTRTGQAEKEPSVSFYFTVQTNHRSRELVSTYACLPTPPPPRTYACLPTPPPPTTTMATTACPDHEQGCPSRGVTMNTVGARRHHASGCARRARNSSALRHAMCHRLRRGSPSSRPLCRRSPTRRSRPRARSHFGFRCGLHASTSFRGHYRCSRPHSSCALLLPTTCSPVRAGRASVWPS